MESVAHDPIVRVLGRQRVVLRDGRHVAVERGVEAGDLRHIGIGARTAATIPRLGADVGID